MLTRLIDLNPDRYNPQMGFKVFDMLMLRHTHLEGPANGVVVVIDMKGGVFGHLTKVNLGEFKKFLIYLQVSQHKPIFAQFPKGTFRLPCPFG